MLPRDITMPEISDAIDSHHYQLPKSKLSLFLQEYIDLDKFETLLWIAARNSKGSIQISKNTDITGEQKKDSDILRVAYDLLQENFSIVLNFAENFDPVISAICNSLSEKYGCVTNAAIFLTPLDGKTFNPHYDNLDVIACQLFGRKNWDLSNKPSNLPLDKEVFDDDFTDDTIESFILEPGDMLFCPRGKVHSVSAKSLSLHISFAMNPIKISDILFTSLKDFERKDKAMRGSYYKFEGFNSKINLSVGSRYEMENNLKKIKMENYAKLPQLPGNFVNRLSFKRSDIVKSFISKRSGMPIEVKVSDDGEKVEVSFPGLHYIKNLDKKIFSMKFPISALPALEFIKIAKGSFTLEQIPGPLNTESITLVVEALIEENILKLEVINE